MKFLKYVKSCGNIMVMSLKMLPLKLKLEVLLRQSIKTKVKEMEVLFASLQEDPYENADEWIRLFDEYEPFMTKKRRQFYIEVIQDNFEEPDERRAVFLEAIGEELYSDEACFLQGIPRNRAGLEKLCQYAEDHASIVGYKLLFNDQEFDQLLSEDEELKSKILTSLKQKSGRSIEHLKDQFPDMFETEASEMEMDEEIWMVSPEIRDYVMDGLP